ncbi:thioesterase thiol ester dehydrase-isomerase [Ephemerocybe angulata]|uniref:Thioesterase thiol ester dehydrase-isomerase n=1 Tax=Ephemerocybe angulata TaxID=980116 RepID=A0A8H6M842_9AGAR|nr:thioesterase thiol ester dehydrase-isomerase [Tulosesus angulatus]
MAACLRFTRRVWRSFLDNKGHDAQCFPNLVVKSAVPGTVEASLKVEQYNIHGGLILSLTDTLGSLAVASKGHFMTGVSTDIGTSFIRPAGKVGDTLHAKAVLTNMGKQLAFTRVDFTNPAGELVAYGFDTERLQENVKFTEDGEQVVEGKDLE